jgi:DNA (cytosine-5)-methyltransferase 1
MRDSLSDALTKKRIEELKLVTKLPFPLLATDGSILAESAEDFQKLLASHVTKKHSQRVLVLNRPSPTVITAPDDYIHPTLPRVLSVRELARLQGFPDAFVFRGKETTGGLKRRTEVPQYSQVGNAVSPYVGKSIGHLATKLLA